ncbi:MAG: Y-family DNA polymerase [Bythopirellula sp.]
MSTQTSPRILCLALPDWPVQHYLQRHPEHKPYALVFSKQVGRSEQVVSCSDRARQLGISSGMRTPDAEALAGPNQLTILPCRPLDDCQGLRALAAACHRFSPVVALENATAPAALLLDANGLSPLWAATQQQGELRLLQAVDLWSRQQQLTVSAAIAQTPGLAWAGAHFPAWLAGRSADQRMIANGHSLEAAQVLPIEALRIDESTINTLVSLGIERIGQLLALPKADLLSRFGPQLGWRMDQLLGQAAEPLSF